MADDISYRKCFVPKNKEGEEGEEGEDDRIHRRLREVVATLPTIKGPPGKPMFQYQGFWYSPDIVGSVGPLAVQDQFKACSSDILIATHPKTGTTWLKSLAFAIMNRKSYSPSDHQHPLCRFNSHDLIPTLEVRLYNDNVNGGRFPDLNMLLPPRLFCTHMPYTSLPQSVTDSGCRVVYICRNTNDTLVSLWHFMNKIWQNNRSTGFQTLEETFESFCKGTSIYGPFWDHVLGYWRASGERPQNVLFLKYEEMQVEPVLHLKRLAEFMGCPFSSMEEKEGVIDRIEKLCSFQNLSALAVNKNATNHVGVTYDAYFRQGKVGDSLNYLTSEMKQQLDCITKQKFQGSGLTF